MKICLVLRFGKIGFKEGKFCSHSPTKKGNFIVNFTFDKVSVEKSVDISLDESFKNRIIFRIVKVPSCINWLPHSNQSV